MQKINGTYYFFGNDDTYTLRKGQFVSCWGNTYYAGANGKIVQGMQNINGKRYYFGNDGTYTMRKNTFFTDNGATYYAGSDGSLLKDVQKINGTYYFFDNSDYHMHTNSYDKSSWGDWYMFGSDGKIVTGWKDWAGSTYYFDPNTYLKVTDTQTIGGVTYQFDSTGRLINNKASVVALAKQLSTQNIPYVWGGSSLSGMDCSGLVAYVYQHALGITLPHNTVAQEAYVSKHSVADAKPGDILFWGSTGATYHDAIYIGNNQYVAAPSTGKNVQVQTISSYFMPSFAGTVK